MEQGRGLRLGKFRSLEDLTVLHHSGHRVDSLLDRYARADKLVQSEKTLTKDTVPVDVDAVCSGRLSTQRELR